jgi:hypothetical protein
MVLSAEQFELSSAEIEFLPLYAIVKERRARLPPQMRGTRCREEVHVELIGIEPTTSSLQSWRSPS